MQWQFTRHRDFEGQHAVFSASQSSWLRYDDDRILDAYASKQAAAKGTRIHEWAKETILLGIKQPRSKRTLYAYVNDAIGFDMTPEVVLYYSPISYGTADAISFDGKTLRIHDLKTGKVGKIESHLEQLEVYAALFCLEYHVKPRDIQIELRVYKLDDVICHAPSAEDIEFVMNKIIHINKLIENTVFKED